MPLFQVDLSQQLALTVFVGTAANYLFRKLYYGFSKQKIKELPPYAPGIQPVIGHLFRMAEKRAPQKIFTEWSKKIGPVFIVQMGENPWLILNSVDAVRSLIVDRGAIYSSRDVSPLITNVLFHGKEAGGGFAFYTNGKEWRDIRKLVYSALTKPKIKSYQHNIDERRDDFFFQLRKKTQNGEAVDIVDLSIYFTMTTMLSIMYGSDAYVYDFEDPELYRIFEQSNEAMNSSSISEAIHNYFPSIAFLVPENIKKYTDIYKITSVFYNKLVNEFRERLEENPDNVKPCVLKEILQIDSQMDNIRLIDIISLSVSAGTETTAGTLQWFVAVMANQPEIQEKAYEEIVKTIGKYKMPGADDAAKLPYIQCIIYEVLRCHPTAPLAIPHCTTEDDIYGDWVIPAGTRVFMNLDSINYDPKYYHEPEKFMPERHMSFVMNPEKNIGYKPHWSFSAGRRMCVGYNLAEGNIFMIVSGLLSSFFIKRETESLIDLSHQRAIHHATSCPTSYKVHFIPRN
ncbi:cytochrome P450 [Spinellus fusiger]|nr:cytochrome P450 [Spinellus fusiger]